ncbi:ras-like protein family member 12 [Periophthalmus magnuspinnatus]|uniref:small monomeric GTPase n=1 Tax=Periophthalmus magnuspinnatus TaxID=409849 RepID=A0A3B3Z7J4_9GOBI|nr:ras-like protein family member 12 [Periophthalmus magnuspinnatus]
MSVMFGKVKVCNLTAVPERCANECNVVLLGATGSGKSALIVKFLTKRFISEYDPRLEDIYASEEIVDQQPVVVRVMDTYDQDGPVNTERYLTWASAFIVVYSIDNQDSFKVCHKYLDTLSVHNKTFKSHIPIVLLGNKLDMERYRQVSKSDGEELASRFGCLFHEISACMDFQDVQQIFHDVVRRTRREGECGRVVYISEDKSLLTLPSPPAFTTPCIKELPAPATAKLVTVKTSRAQSKRRAATLTLLKGFKIF